MSAECCSGIHHVHFNESDSVLVPFSDSRTWLPYCLVRSTPHNDSAMEMVFTLCVNYLCLSEKNYLPFL